MTQTWLENAVAYPVPLAIAFGLICCCGVVALVADHLDSRPRRRRNRRTRR